MDRHYIRAHPLLNISREHSTATWTIHLSRTRLLVPANMSLMVTQAVLCRDIYKGPFNSFPKCFVCLTDVPGDEDECRFKGTSRCHFSRKLIS